MNTSTHKNLYQRILAVMGDIDYIQKGDKKVAGQYTYVSHDQVSGALHPLLVKHGICVIPTTLEMSQDGNRTSLKLEVVFVNADKPDERLSSISYGYGIDTGDKGIGKAYSYAYKYALLKMFCLETGDDPDHDQNVEHNLFTLTVTQMYFLKDLLNQYGVTEEQFFSDAKMTGWHSIDSAKKFMGAQDWIKNKYEKK